MRLDDHCKSALALVTVVAFLLAGCSTTKELGRRTIRVEREPISKDFESQGLEIEFSRDLNSVKLRILEKGLAKVKETNVEEVSFEERSVKGVGKVMSIYSFTIGLVTVILPIMMIIANQIALKKGDPRVVEINHYSKKEPGEERIIKEEATIPVNDAHLTIKINDFQQVLRSDHEGKAEINLLPVLNTFHAIPGQLLVSCSAQIKDKSLTKELTIPKGEIVRIVQSETGRPQLPPNLMASVNFENSNGIVHTANTDKLVVTVTNRGQGEAYQVRGTIICPDPLLDGKEIIFGRLDPGKTKKAFVLFEVPAGYPPKLLPIEIHFSEYNKYSPKIVETSLSIFP